MGLSPATNTAVEGGTHTVTAKAESTGGSPVPGATVNFTILTGPNAGLTGTGTTGATGEATFTYTDAGPDGTTGKDTIQAKIGSLESNIVEMNWTPKNRPPVANAGPDAEINADASCVGSATLNGAGSGDPDFDTLTYSWTGPNGFTSSLATVTVGGLAPGSYTYTLTVSDGKGGTSTDSVTITIVDKTAPILTLPADPTVEQSNRAGTPVALAATATDGCSAVTVTSDAPASGTYPLGTTVVHFTATDAAGNSTTGSVTVTVKDTTAPTLTVPAAVTVEQANLAGTAVTLGAATATDICDASPTITNNAPATYPLGTTTVTYTAVDASGNVTTKTTTVTVKDTTKPTITTSLLSPATLWPVNHNMIAIGTIAISDICDAKPTIGMSITQDEPLNATGDGNFSADASVTFTGNTANVNLRAERSGNSDGRVYLLKTTTTDASGNTAYSCSAVTVSKSQSNADKTSVANQAAAAVAACNATGATLQFSSTNGPIVGPKQ